MRRSKWYLLFSLLLILSCSMQCSSSKSVKNNSENSKQYVLQTNVPFALGQSYYQKWIAGVQGGGSGINLTLIVSEKPTTINFDSAYFSGLSAKIISGINGYTAHFKTAHNQKDDFIMSGNSKDEFGNTLPKHSKFPFQLEDDECVISYSELNVTKYYKIKVVEKPMQNYPSAPPKKQ